VRGGGDLLYKEPRKIEVRLTLTTGDVKLLDKVQKPSINEYLNSQPFMEN
jgi:hypothetical protein